jgi:hypothetical protein
MREKTKEERERKETRGILAGIYSFEKHGKKAPQKID